MKWYSVKKFRPPVDCLCMIRNADGYFWIATWENEKGIITENYSKGWIKNDSD